MNADTYDLGDQSSGLLNITEYDTRRSVGDAPEIRVAKRRSPGIPRAGASFYSAAKLARFLRLQQEISAETRSQIGAETRRGCQNPDGNAVRSR